MADTENNAMPDIDSMDDAALDTLKADMMSGKDVTAPADPAPESEQQPAPEAVATESDEGEEQHSEQPSRQESVPFGRFERERLRRKEAEDNATSIRQQYEQRLQDIITSLGGPKKDEPTTPEIPDRVTQPIDFIGHLEQNVTDLKKQIEAREATDQQQRQVTEFRNAVAEQFQVSVQENPLVVDAYSTLVERFNGIADAYGLKGKERNDWLNQQVDQQASDAFRMGRPLGDHIVALAKGYGWDGKARQQAKPAPTPETVQANANERQNILRASASLSGGGGGPAQTGMPTPQQLLEMTPKQYDEFRTKHDIRQVFAA